MKEILDCIALYWLRQCECETVDWIAQYCECETVDSTVSVKQLTELLGAVSVKQLMVLWVWNSWLNHSVQWVWNSRLNCSVLWEWNSWLNHSGNECETVDGTVSVKHWIKMFCVGCRNWLNGLHWPQELWNICWCGCLLLFIPVAFLSKGLNYKYALSPSPPPSHQQTMMLYWRNWLNSL